MNLLLAASNKLARTRYHRATLLVVLSCGTAACGAGPLIVNNAGFTERDVLARRVVMLPLATSSQVGDDRTGIVLDDGSVRAAHRDACAQLRDDLSTLELRCSGAEQLRVAGAPLREINLKFAGDQAIPLSLCRALANASGAAFALMFRPESVHAKNHGAAISGGMLTAVNNPVVYGGPLYGPTVGLASLMIVASGLTKERRRRSYAISSALLDLGKCRLQRVGSHEVDAMTRGAAYPEAAPILAEAMRELGAAMIAGAENVPDASASVFVAEPRPGTSPIAPQSSGSAAHTALPHPKAPRGRVHEMVELAQGVRLELFGDVAQFGAKVGIRLSHALSVGGPNLADCAASSVRFADQTRTLATPVFHRESQGAAPREVAQTHMTFEDFVRMIEAGVAELDVCGLRSTITKAAMVGATRFRLRFALQLKATKQRIVATAPSVETQNAEAHQAQPEEAAALEAQVAGAMEAPEAGTEAKAASVPGAAVP